MYILYNFAEENNESKAQSYSWWALNGCLWRGKLQKSPCYLDIYQLILMELAESLHLDASYLSNPQEFKKIQYVSVEVQNKFFPKFTCDVHEFTCNVL